MRAPNRPAVWRRAPRAAGAALAAVASAALTPPLRGSPVLNEVLYDPAGADAGREFVELYNPGPEPFPLQGCRLEFANGAVAPAWLTRWTGSAADTLAPGGVFLIADEGWTGPPEADAVASLALQNGPDAVRLSLPSGAADRLGYGALADTAFFEGKPHPGARSGQSLSRHPDGRDTHDNAADWVETAAPTPGRINYPARAAMVDAFTAEPPSLAAAGLEASLALHLVNTGLLPLPAGPVRLLDRNGGDGPTGWLDPLAAGEAQVLRLTWRPLAEGRRAFSLEIPGDECGPPLSVAVGGYQVGVAGLYLSEVMPAPPRAGCEWFELGNAGGEPVDLGSAQVRDEDGTWRQLPAATLAPGAFVVVVQDREKFASWWRGLASSGAPGACDAEAVVAGAVALPGWPSLNNTPPADRGFADRLYVGDADGTVLDHVTFGAGGAPVPAGRSLERASPRPWGSEARNWGPAPAAAGSTPGCANSLARAGPPSAELSLLPNPFVPAAGGILHLLFTVRERQTGWDARVYDLWGRRVRDLGSDNLGPGPRDVVWDGTDDGGTRVGPGGYVVLVRSLGPGSRPGAACKRLAVVEAP